MCLSRVSTFKVMDPIGQLTLNTAILLLPQCCCRHEACPLRDHSILKFSEQLPCITVADFHLHNNSKT